MPAKVISLASSKGGVGKTTIAILLAAAFRSVGLQVAIVDADRNRSIHRYFSQEGPADASPDHASRLGIVAVTAQAAQVMDAIQAHMETADVVIVDLEGSENQGVVYAIAASDLVIIPSQASGLDVAEAVKILATVRSASKIARREIASRIVMSRSPVLAQRLSWELRDAFVAQGAEVFKVEMIDRMAFRAMTLDRIPVSVLRSGSKTDMSAAANARALAQEVADAVGLRATISDTARENANVDG
jgi:chromosome partitioning protein